MKISKMTKTERKIHLLEGLLARREREIRQCNKSWQEEVAKIERKNKFTRYQIEEIKAGRWPL